MERYHLCGVDQHQILLDKTLSGHACDNGLLLISFITERHGIYAAYIYLTIIVHLCRVRSAENILQIKEVVERK